MKVRRERAFSFCFLPFCFLPDSPVGCSPDAAKAAVLYPSSFHLSIIRMSINHGTAFHGQRPIHPRTAAPAYPDQRAVSLLSAPRHDRVNRAMSGSRSMRKSRWRTASRYGMVPSSHHNSITASHTHLFFLMRSYDHGGDFSSFGTAYAFDQRLSTNLPFSFHRLDKKSICRTFRRCHPMPMSSFCIVKIKCLTL